MAKKMRRIKDVPCVLCGEATRDVDAVCTACRRQWKDGELYHQKVKSGEVVEWAVSWYWQFYHFLGDGQRARYSRPGEKSVEAEIRECVLTLAGVDEVESRHYQSPSDNRARPMIGAGTRYEDSYTLFTGRPEVFETMLRLVQAIRDYVAKEYQDGLDEGRRFVRLLASGDLSVHEANEWEIKHAVKIQSPK